MSDRIKGWDDLDDSKVSREEIDESFKAVMERIGEEEASRRRTMVIRLRKAVVAAAAIVLLIITPVTAILLRNSKEESGILTEYITGKGEIREIILPDGSKVTMNADSKLSYPEKFGKTRKVSLEGEALFDVESDKKAPFVVSAADIAVKVHGTVFNVNAYPESTHACVTLCEGAVSVEISESEATTLVPGQKFVYDKTAGKGKVESADTAEATAWKDGHICFKSQPVREVFSIIEKRFGVKIHVAEEAYSSAILTAKFVNGESVEQMMDAICQVVPGMEYTMKDNHIYVK